MASVTRFGLMRKIFKNGESELLNGIARLSILYEDLRLEAEEFRKLYKSVIEREEDPENYRVNYFLRRSLVSLTEYRSALTVVRMTDEFKQAESRLTTFELD